MTNYNDGKWHGWNGGECPVHPKTKVGGFEKSGASWVCYAGDNDWKSFRGMFKVIKEHREPREFWVCKCGAYDSEGEAILDGNSPSEIIHVREVLE